MLLNAIEGVIENGKIRLSESVALPENARVYVIIAQEIGAAHVQTPRLARPEQSKDFRKQIVEISPDAKL